MLNVNAHYLSGWSVFYLECIRAKLKVIVTPCKSSRNFWWSNYDRDNKDYKIILKKFGGNIINWTNSNLCKGIFYFVSFLMKWLIELHGRWMFRMRNQQQVYVMNSLHWVITRVMIFYQYSHSHNNATCRSIMIYAIWAERWFTNQYVINIRHCYYLTVRSIFW